MKKPNKPTKKEVVFLSLSWLLLVIIAAVFLDVSLPMSVLGSSLLVVWVLLLDNGPRPLG